MTEIKQQYETNMKLANDKFQIEEEKYKKKIYQLEQQCLSNTTSDLQRASFHPRHTATMGAKKTGLASNQDSSEMIVQENYNYSAPIVQYKQTVNGPGSGRINQQIIQTNNGAMPKSTKRPELSREKHREIFNRSTVIQSSHEFTDLERDKSDAQGGRAKSPDIIQVKSAGLRDIQMKKKSLNAATSV
jgi:hypothetical protein